jgi:small-conductance mechanosensitive channel
MQQLIDWLGSQDIGGWLRAALILVIGIPVTRLLSRALYRMLRSHMGENGAVTLRRVVFYGLTAIVAMAALRELGFKLGVLLGAAGVLSVALGFASQTSASNLVSGIFLVAERTFGVGDVIKIGDTTGEVLAIDLLSVKLRTFDNLFVRVPNESLIKSQITNFTRFPIRRLDLQIGVAYKEDIGRVRDILIRVADTYPLCLDEPRPLTIFQGFGDSALNLQFSVWTKRENYLALRNAMPEAVKRAFDEAAIEIPFPHRSLYAGSMTDPFPVRVVEAGPVEGKRTP